MLNLIRLLLAVATAARFKNHLLVLLQSHVSFCSFVYISKFFDFYFVVCVQSNCGRAHGIFEIELRLLNIAIAVTERHWFTSPLSTIHRHTNTHTHDNHTYTTNHIFSTDTRFFFYSFLLVINEILQCFRSSKEQFDSTRVYNVCKLTVQIPKHYRLKRQNEMSLYGQCLTKELTCTPILVPIYFVVK